MSAAAVRGALYAAQGLDAGELAARLDARRLRSQPCPWCGAREWWPCVLAESTSPLAGVHPSRADAVAAANAAAPGAAA